MPTGTGEVVLRARDLAKVYWMGEVEVHALRGVDEQRVNLVIDLDDPPEVWSELGDGYRVEARIVVQEAEDVIKVDDSAVFRHGDGWAVFRVDGGRAVLTPIEIGARNGLEVEVVEGLDADTLVIVHPGDQVEDGRRVRPRKG